MFPPRGIPADVDAETHRRIAHTFFVVRMVNGGLLLVFLAVVAMAIELNDSGGEARARLVSAVERVWLPDEMVRSAEELFFNPTRGQVEARVRTYWADLMLEESPAAIGDAAAAAAILAQQARQQLEHVLPAAESAGARRTAASK